MDAVLVKYRGKDSEYLVYDSVKYSAGIQPRSVRSICSFNFGLSAAGVMVGPYKEGGSLVMKVYAPDGEEKPLEKDALAVCGRYLKDAGYLAEETGKYGSAGLIGRVYLSEQFVNTYM